MVSAARGAEGGAEPPADRPVKVAIIGGGCAGLAAAWELSRAESGRAERFEITVYEQSWRLGGKGASGRDAHGRIREHGIHIWLGFYENAFRMMRECYKEVEERGWGPSQDEPDDVLPYGRFDQAFFPESHVAVASKTGGDLWEAWSGHLPPMAGLPGTPLDEQSNPFTLQAYLASGLAMAKALIHSVLGPAGDKAADDASRPSERSTLDAALDLDFSFDPTESPAVLVERLMRLLRAGLLTTAAGVLQSVTIIESLLRERNPAPQFSEGVLHFAEALTAQIRKQLRDLVGIDAETRRKTQIIDLIMTIMVGLYRDRVLTHPQGLDAINHIDCKRWLLRHGAVKESVASPFVTGLYDLAFCYRGGDRRRPALAAGQAIRGALRMFFSYRGAVFWRMSGGMGETVFSPLFRVLKARGVRFRFLHGLRAVGLEGQGTETRVSTLTFAATRPADGFSDDRPLDHFGCWRHDPPAAAPASGDVGSNSASAAAEPVTLRDGEDFDAVVLAMGVDDFNKICGADLAARDPAWREMRKHVRTIATQAAQVWMTVDLPELGWRRGSVLLSGMEGPFETWADMTHTLAAERAWRAHPRCPLDPAETHDAVKSVAYFCGVLPDQAIADQQQKPGSDAAHVASAIKQQVKKDLARLMRRRMRCFWPLAASPLNVLATSYGTIGGTLADQHIQANVIGSERYTLALPGSLEHRISPLRNTVNNMTIAGDWTECGFNEGCIEAAVMSGMLAAHALSGRPDLDDIIGYNHP